MPVHFVDNYPKSELERIICKPNGEPLHGELWVYREFQKFNEYGFLKNENWYLKHNYNLSSHPASTEKVEGQIDFLLLSRYGILVIEVKGGGIEVDENDVYYNYNSKGERREGQNPFNQVKEYFHTLKKLIDSKPFIYRCVLFPHEAGFELRGPQLIGYKYLFFSKRDLNRRDTEYGRTQLFFDFLIELAKESRRHIIRELSPSPNKSQIEERIWKQFKELDKESTHRLRNELFPTQTSYGYEPDKIKAELIQEENYEILKGLRKNRRVLIQGAPGTGKTIIATKFLAENVLKQQRGIFFCANKLLRAKMEHLIYEEYKLDPSLISFKVFYKDLHPADIKDVDFLIFDEAQEFFDKGLFDFISKVDQQLSNPKFLILYDPEQTIAQDYKDVEWYADYFIEDGYMHYYFDTVWRCAQSKEIYELSIRLKNGEYKKVATKNYSEVNDDLTKLKYLKLTLDKIKTDHHKSILLVESSILDAFRNFCGDYFKNDIVELTEHNINVKTQKLKFTTPIKFRGLEADNVILLTPSINDKTRIQNFIAITRAIFDLQIVKWS